ncbi:MAG: hypothetical protein KZQ80_13990 [Candidatus Thiodiazotropha sp. (ex Monitilora ramsayi)]|nr:hypothetical protein [Candidatus Thiodiazotropha sp. (ex Monitilora ramsayi)]
MDKKTGSCTDKSCIKQLKVKAWFYYVATKLDLKPTGYALEKHFDRKRIKPNDAGTISRPCKFDKYQKGLHMPNPELIDKIEIEAQGSKSLIYHPFWDLCSPIQDLADLYLHLSKLRSEVRDLLFLPGSNPGEMPIRNRIYYEKNLRILARMADLDALSALLGVHQEDCIAEKHGMPKLHVYYLKPFMLSFRRLVSYPPFPHIAHDLFDCLYSNLLKILTSRYAKSYLGNVDVSRSIEYSRLLITIANKVEVFQGFSSPPISSMYIIERYMNKKTIMMALRCESDYDWREFKKYPDIKNMIRTLRRWEQIQTHLYTNPWS